MEDDDKTILKTAPVDDKTVFKPVQSSEKESDTLHVDLFDAQEKIINSFSFTKDFSVGRALDNAIITDSTATSRHHLEIKRENKEWWVYNQSANGIFIDNNLIEQKKKLTFPAVIALGNSGLYLSIQQLKPGENIAQKPIKPPPPVVNITPPPTKSAPPSKKLSQEEIESRYLADEDPENMGDHTRMVRKSIHKDRTKRGKSYKKIIWALGILFGISIGIVTYQHIALSNARKLAIDMFYDIKTLEVSISQADIRLEQSANELNKTRLAISAEKLKLSQEQLKLEQEKIEAERKRMIEEREKLASMKTKYQQYVQHANSLSLHFPGSDKHQEELIAKVAREFGESELELPDDFVQEVKKYISYWQNTPRMQNAINTALENNYFPIILTELKKQGLPLQFLYLPLQESNYNTRIIGPSTRYGIAKGAWQFIPETGRTYGLANGPLSGVREYDAQDDRFNFKLASAAGAKYLKTIFSTKAQASGLLVIASYNWGEGRVIKNLGRMPDNPRDKNFWKFQQQFDMPQETYDYVLYIFSAAVIGEDPQYFGFKFNSPLLQAQSNSTIGK